MLWIIGGIVLWLLVVVFVLALCKAAAYGDQVNKNWSDHGV